MFEPFPFKSNPVQYLGWLLFSLSLKFVALTFLAYCFKGAWNQVITQIFNVKKITFIQASGLLLIVFILSFCSYIATL